MQQLLRDINGWSTRSEVDDTFTAYSAADPEDVTILRALVLTTSLTVELSKRPSFPNPNNAFLDNDCALPGGQKLLATIETSHDYIALLEDSDPNNNPGGAAIEAVKDFLNEFTTLCHVLTTSSTAATIEATEATNTWPPSLFCSICFDRIAPKQKPVSLTFSFPGFGALIHDQGTFAGATPLSYGYTADMWIKVSSRFNSYLTPRGTQQNPRASTHPLTAPGELFYLLED